MNAYFLLEGRRSEPQVYSAWLALLAPGLTRVHHHDAVTDQTFYLFTAGGYPGIVNTHAPNAVRDVNSVGKYEYLVVGLDADESSVDDRKREVVDSITAAGLKLQNAELVVIVQNRCLETWFLGNKRIVTRNPQSETLREYLQYYNVVEEDPEALPCYPGFSTHAQFHHEYLRAVFAERGIVYSKRNPRYVCHPTYLDELNRRVQEFPQHLRSLQALLATLRQFNNVGTSNQSPATNVSSA